MKRIIVYLMILCLLVTGMTACGGSGEENETSNDVTTENASDETTTEDESSNDVNSNNGVTGEIRFNYEELEDGTICIYEYDADVVPTVIEIPAEYEGKTVTEIRTIFSGDDQVKKVILPETLRVIGKKSFARASALEEIEIKGAVERIEEEAIFECNKLTQLTFKEGLKVAEVFGICLCANLSEVHLPGTLEDLTEHGNFGGCAADLTLYGPAGSFVEQYANECGFNFVAE